MISMLILLKNFPSFEEFNKILMRKKKREGREETTNPQHQAIYYMSTNKSNLMPGYRLHE